MKQLSLTSTTEGLDTYSAGVSNLNSTMLWNQHQYWVATDKVDEFEQWGSDFTGINTNSTYIVRPEAAGFQSNDIEWTILLLCHWLIDRIPKEGLADLIESLLSIYSFYRTNNLPTRPLLSSTTHTTATVRDTITRPPFKVEMSEG